MPDPVPDPTPRPPTDWTKIALAAIGFATLMVNVNCNHEATRERQIGNERKIDAVGVKADTAASHAEVAKEKAAVADAKLDDLKRTMTALPPPSPLKGKDK